MKPITLKSLSALLIFSVFVLSSCKKDKCLSTVTYKKYVPVYMSYADLRSAVSTTAAQPLKKPGKIYLKGNYIFVSETDKGIHVIDNTNPSSPQNIAFINIPGNLDLASSGNMLYADSYVDLLTFDISNPNSITLKNRVQNALPYRNYTYGYAADATQGVVIDWQQKLVTEKVSNNCDGSPVYPIMYDNTGALLTPNSNSNTTTTYTNPNAPGIGGSTAKFTVSNNALYIVDNTQLHVYDITNNSAPSKVSDQDVGWSIETIFPYKSHYLFIGSNSGVYIYDNSNPLSPTMVSEYSHLTACDPVVADDDNAYFTLSNDAPCHMGVNELDVVSITNISNPTLTTTIPMTNPKGIGIDNKTLFICDSNDGLKVYDATDVMQIQNRLLAHFSNINSFDVIPYNHHLLMIGSDGLYQYDYTNIQNITLLSTIPVTP